MKFIFGMFCGALLLLVVAALFGIILEWRSKDE